MNGDQQMSVIWYLLVLLLPLAALFARRIPIGHVMRMALMWVGIFAVGLILATLWTRNRGAVAPAPWAYGDDDLEGARLIPSRERRRGPAVRSLAARTGMTTSRTRVPPSSRSEVLSLAPADGSLDSSREISRDEPRASARTRVRQAKRSWQGRARHEGEARG